jgi:hypothetical protein
MSKPSMTRAHYCLIADVIARLPHATDGINSIRTLVADEFARALQGTNPAFDMGRFLDAANGTPRTGRDKVRG